MAFGVKKPGFITNTLSKVENGARSTVTAPSASSRLKNLASAVQGGAKIIGSTRSGGIVRTRSAAEIAAASKNSFSSGSSNKRNRRRNNPVNNVVDARHIKSNNGGAQGQIICSLINKTSRDRDDKNNTLSEWLKRKLETNDQEFLRDLNQGVLRLPQGGVIGIRKNKQLYTTDTRTRAVSGGFGGGSAGGGTGRAGIASSGGTIGLPTPDNLVENMRLNYSSRAQPVFAAIQNALQNGIRAGARGVIGADKGGTTIEETIATIQKEAASVFSEIDKDFTERNALNNLIRMGNMVGDRGVNDATSFNNTMLQQFEGVQPRTFSFQWKLYAANAGESASIFQIIDLLKQASHPLVVNPSLDIIEYPMTLKNFQIRSPNGVIIFPIFESVISGITVDYSASGAPYFFKGGAPTSISLNLTITEIRSLTREDWTGGSSTSSPAPADGSVIGGGAGGPTA